MKAVLLALAVLAVSCASGPSEGTGDEGALSRGVNVGVYEGAFRDYRPLAETSLEERIRSAGKRIRERLGVTPDPLRTRVVRLADDREGVAVRTLVVDGREVQEVVLPAATMARGHLDPDQVLTLALARAWLTDPVNRDLPAWLREGAPLWVSGLWEQELYRAVLGGPAVISDPDRVAPAFGLDDARVSPLSGAIFLRLLAEEFGADRIPLLTVPRSESRTALATVLETEPDTLPLAFETAAALRVAEIAGDPVARELDQARRLPAAERVLRLTGLVSRASNGYLAAAVLSELGLALFEAGNFEEAAETLARLERLYPRQTLHPDRDRVHFALTFARRGEGEGSVLRLSSFLVEFPESSWRVPARFELGAALLDLGRTEEAMAEFAAVVRDAPGSALAPPAALLAAGYERGRHRYAAARSLLTATERDPRAAAALRELDAEVGGGLPPAARPVAEEALRDLASSSPDRRERGREVLAAMGPATGALLGEALAGEKDFAFRRAAVDVARGWPLESARPVLMRLLADQDLDLVRSVFDAFAALGAGPDQMRGMIDLHPFATPAAEAVWAERFGASGGASLEAGLATSADHEDRARAARDLAVSREPGALEALGTLARDISPQVRQAAALALGARAEPAAGEVLEELLGDDSPLVRGAAVEGLGTRRVFRPLRDTALADPDARVLRLAAQQLLARGGESEVGAVLDLLLTGDAGIGSPIEALLRASPRPAFVPLLAERLPDAEAPGAGIRIVRVLAALTGTDFGFDPAGGAEERERVAAAAKRWWEERS